MKIKIKNRYIGNVLYEVEAEDMRDAVVGLVAEGKSLEYASLDGANLKYASLDGANLNGASLNGVNLDGASLEDANLKYANLKYASLDGASLDDANLKYASLDGANLNGASLNGVNLDGASLDGVNLKYASLDGVNFDGAILDSIKSDLLTKLHHAKNEAPDLLQAIKDGNVDGSCYKGECCCFVGTIANVRGVGYKEIEGIKPNSDSLTERWFLGIYKGDNPENSQVAKITAGWIEEFIKEMK